MSGCRHHLTMGKSEVNSDSEAGDCWWRVGRTRLQLRGCGVPRSLPWGLWRSWSCSRCRYRVTGKLCSVSAR